MTAPRARAAAGLALLAVLAPLLSACGSGGFGGKQPESLDTSITRYVALGDGFAAAPYVGRTTDEDGCLRAELNYPQQVATSLGVPDFKDVSCVGATTKAVTGPFRPPGAKKDVAAQLDAVTPDTDLVTISIGIMNSSLLTGMFDICVAQPCGTKVLPKDLVDQLNQLTTDLPATIRAITDKAPQAYVVVVGYPELLPFVRDCKALPKMDDTQWSYANRAWRQFSTTVGSSARQAGAAYVDVRRLSEEHAPCSEHPWVNTDAAVPGKSFAYHPKALEQSAVAEAVVGQVRTR